MELTITNLSKQYSNGPKVLDDINLTITNGMYGLLGPNGAGKSTLMRTLATLQLPDAGQMVLDDLDIVDSPHDIRKQLGYLPQDFGLFPKVRAYDLLMHIAWVKGVADKKNRANLVNYTLEQVNLQDHKNKMLGSYSGGMKQRFGIAQAIIGDPKFLIADEPTAGLDPVERNRFYNILSELSGERIVILSTHIVEDVNTLCDKMAILNNGKIVAEGNPADLISTLSGHIYSLDVSKEELADFSNQYNILSKVLRHGRFVIRIYSTSELTNGLKPEHPTLEDLYFVKISNFQE